MKKTFVVLDDDADIQRMIFRYAKRIEPPVRLVQLFELNDALSTLGRWLVEGTLDDIAAIFVDGRMGSPSLNTEPFVQAVRVEMAEGRASDIVLVASASDPHDRKRLLRAGCTLECEKAEIGQMIQRLAQAEAG